MTKILVSGCFDDANDKLHLGHLHLLAQAKGYCLDTFVVVVVMTDSYIRNTKHREPNHSLMTRVMAVEKLPTVDVVYTAKNNFELQMLCDSIRPKYRLVGSDYKQSDVIKNEDAEVLIVERI